MNGSFCNSNKQWQSCCICYWGHQDTVPQNAAHFLWEWRDEATWDCLCFRVPCHTSATLCIIHACMQLGAFAAPIGVPHQVLLHQLQTPSTVQLAQALSSMGEGELCISAWDPCTFLLVLCPLGFDTLSGHFESSLQVRWPDWLSPALWHQGLSNSLPREHGSVRATSAMWSWGDAADFSLGIIPPNYIFVFCNLFFSLVMVFSLDWSYRCSC